MFSLDEIYCSRKGFAEKNATTAHKKRPDEHHVVKTEFINYF